LYQEALINQDLTKLEGQVEELCAEVAAVSVKYGRHHLLDQVKTLLDDSLRHLRELRHHAHALSELRQKLSEGESSDCTNLELQQQKVIETKGILANAQQLASETREKMVQMCMSQLDLTADDQRAAINAVPEEVLTRVHDILQKGDPRHEAVQQACRNELAPLGASNEDLDDLQIILINEAWSERVDRTLDSISWVNEAAEVEHQMSKLEERVNSQLGTVDVKGNRIGTDLDSAHCIGTSSSSRMSRRCKTLPGNLTVAATSSQVACKGTSSLFKQSAAVPRTGIESTGSDLQLVQASQPQGDPKPKQLGIDPTENIGANLDLQVAQAASQPPGEPKEGQHAATGNESPGRIRGACVDLQLDLQIGQAMLKLPGQSGSLNIERGRSIRKATVDLNLIQPASKPPG